ncbi:winged helix-turn-helix domain-containing protein [Sphingomonas jaspsi]|uniref:winged helix-turn-helix domain-containing protein n=1 Tax=Sphingomonas jaspsi TaxID=392409 RepID=UPI0004B42730|nr:winged helix-turn-helix domain-containing protein [Sphingomonas jaspsi]
MDRDDERLVGPSGPIKLGNKAFRLLNMLVDHGGRLVTKDAIFSSVWDGTFVSESALTSTIKELRRALGDLSKTPSYIESVYGRGYRLIADIGEADDAPIATPTTPAKGKPSVKVSDLSDDPPVIIVSEFNDAAVRQSLPYLGEGLREEILSSLAQFRDIQLVANSQFDERNPQVAAPERSYHLTATLLPDRDSAKIIARTKRVSDGRVLWAENMSLANMGNAEGVDRIVKRIAGSLLPAVDQDLISGVARHGANLFDRYLIVKRGVLSVRTYEDAKRSVDDLEAIIAERPDFGLPYAQLVRFYNTDYFFTSFGASDKALRARALKMARAGFATDPSHSMNYLTIGFCNLYAGKFAEAKEMLEQAFERNPYSAERANQVATGMVYLGEFDRARQLFALSHELQPWSDNDNLEQEGRLHLLEGNDQAASAAFAAVTEPLFWGRFYQSLSDMELGLPEAPAMFRRWRERVESNWHDGSHPDSDMIMAMIRSHHPFDNGYGARLFELAEKALNRD